LKNENQQPKATRRRNRRSANGATIARSVAPKRTVGLVAAEGIAANGTKAAIMNPAPTAAGIA
jgi:hypothetical protein